VNQRDRRGLTALHRAAFLAQYEGYMEIYEYLLARARAPRLPARACLARLCVACSPAADACGLSRPRAQSEGADPGVLSDDFDPYLNPGRHAPVQLATDDPEARAASAHATRPARKRLRRIAAARAGRAAGRALQHMPACLRRCTRAQVRC
jgi:hypothetical protein